MITMKFGGTSIGTAKTIHTACRLIQTQLSRRPLVVVSAHNSPSCRMTDTLIASAEAALEGLPDKKTVRRLQETICHDLKVDPAPLLGDLLDEYERLITGIGMIQELSPRTLDLVMSFGERMSSRLIAAVLLRDYGIKAIQVDAFDLGLLTTANFGYAHPVPDCYPTIKRIVEQLDAEAIVTTGFIGKGPHGHITTLGRGGSDYSATIFGAAIGAEEVQIWTDVSGVMTADPSVVPTAGSISELSFMEASELAWFGAKVLHPATMLPAIQHNIPLRVMNTHEPEHPGTVIRHALEEEKAVAKSIVYKEHTHLVTLISSRLVGAHAFLAKVFTVFDHYKIDIHMIATSEVSISLSIPNGEHLRKAADELAHLAEVNIQDDMSLVCVVGEGMAGIKGVAQRVCGALTGAGVNIKMISQGARELNIALLVDDQDVEPAVQALHAEFFQ